MLAIALVALLGIQQDSPQRLTLYIEGARRRAYVFPGTAPTTKPRPVVFAFHGFGGSGLQAFGTYRLHRVWPEAIVVYPTGLETRNARLKSIARGWQSEPNGEGDRDLKFVDEILRQVEGRYKVDPKRIYACGMSNGGLFTYLLLHTRPTKFAAFASVAAMGGTWLANANHPKPFMMIFGKKDPLIPKAGFELSKDFMVKLNGCAKQPVVWRRDYQLYKGKGGNDVVARIHELGHKWVPGTSEAIVDFFKQH